MDKTGIRGVIFFGREIYERIFSPWVTHVLFMKSFDFG